MNWSNVGEWIKNNAGTGAALIGSLLTGSVPGAIAAGASLVASATGTDDPDGALSILQADPKAMVRLRELYYQNESEIRTHLETMTRLDLEDKQKEHETTQETIRAGDSSSDEYVRHTRPGMARQSWTATIAYCLGCWVYNAFTGHDIFNIYIAGVLSSPAWAYIGFRTGDKFASALSTVRSSK